MENVEKIDNGYKIVVPKRIYEKEAVLSVSYKYCDRFLIELESIDDDRIAFIVTEKKQLPAPVKTDVESILADLLDEQLRLEILHRTKEIREIIYKKAFSPLEGE